ncbi:hypothetical protein E1281_33925 [Actinomadura sp. KC345]|uniref:hypothetical protein n=1 Tax=Actinomadura sp. KC345 TaxID=2530371 RepID=UPI001044B577|nr:hypothetical protein [Actinomadura sp. KC345]TDC44462.1 hypothetical protein E1281_33925 [Actinomadura sp. KC345]
MPKLTDYVRQGYRRRQRPWDRTELPEWWDVAIWVAAAAIIVMLVVSVVLSDDDAPAPRNAGGAPTSYPAETLNPRALASSGSESAPPSGAASSSPKPPVELSPEGFKATNAVQVPITGGDGTAIVPAGARNVATAAARAMAIGDWSGIPFVGTARPSAPAGRTPQGSVIGEVTVMDPSTTGNSQYRFTAQITQGGNAKPREVRFAVEQDGAGYAIRVG